MSMDYPFYQELVRRRHRAAWWWLMGDRLYYLGLITAVIGVSCVGPGIVMGLLGKGWHLAIVALVCFVPGVFVWRIGSSFKDRSYRLARRDGIEP